MTCTICNDEIHLDYGNWLPCSECDRTYHLYCLDPLPLDKPNGGWICPKHENYNQNHEENIFDTNLDSMILFPFQMIPKVENISKRRTIRAPIKSITVSKSQQKFIYSYQKHKIISISLNFSHFPFLFLF